MDVTTPHKVTPRHLRRQAYLYIRQSTLRQVVENTESTERQYALRQRAVALGWPIEQAVVIDRDLGRTVKGFNNWYAMWGSDAPASSWAWKSPA